MSKWKSIDENLLICFCFQQSSNFVLPPLGERLKTSHMISTIGEKQKSSEIIAIVEKPLSSDHSGCSDRCDNDR